MKIYERHFPNCMNSDKIKKKLLILISKPPMSVINIHDQQRKLVLFYKG